MNRVVDTKEISGKTDEAYSGDIFQTENFLKEINSDFTHFNPFLSYFASDTYIDLSDHESISEENVFLETNFSSLIFNSSFVEI
jgi:hypothetical protein